jgi:hypothetical protein
MRNRSFTPMGSMHPVLFFVVMYTVALFFSIFICSSLFYSCNTSSSGSLVEKSSPVKESTSVSANTVALSK